MQATAHQKQAIPESPSTTLVSNLDDIVPDFEEPTTTRRWHQVLSGPVPRVIIYATACLTTSCIYFGWQPFSEMLFRSGAYSWLCPDDFDFEGQTFCEEQDAAVTRLYSAAQGSEFAFAFVAGLLLDHVGPRFTALIGESLFAISLFLLCLSRRSFQAYIPAMVISGGCVNIVSFPSLVITELWPARQALAVSIIVGAQSGASIIAPIMLAIWNNNPKFTLFGLWGSYLAAIWIPVSSLYLLALPARRNYSQLVQTKLSSTEASQPSASQSMPVPYSSVEQEHKLPSSTISRSVTPLTSSEEVKFVGSTGKERWLAFLRDLKAVDTILCAVFLFLLMLQFAYYPSVLRSAVSDEISSFVGWMTPLQAPFSIMIGFIMDYTGTCLVMYGMCGTLIFVSLSTGLAPSVVGLQRFVGIIFVFMQSATYNLKYTYVNEMYDPYNFGKLVGFLGIMGGVGAYVNMPISTRRNYLAVFLVYTGVALMMIVITTILFIRQLRGVSYKSAAGVEQTKRLFKKNKEPTVDEAEFEV